MTGGTGPSPNKCLGNLLSIDYLRIEIADIILFTV